MMYAFDREIAGRGGYRQLCGIDEAGCGPLAGPVCAAAVILGDGPEIPGLNDSKKLSEKKREALFEIICARAAAFHIAAVGEGDIDRINILQARLWAMRQAVDGLALLPDCALVDGDRDPGLQIPALLVVRGDGQSAAIAAASILAKVFRDRHMRALALRYPQYGFEQHKGYPTPLHYARLAAHGPSPVHRLSFLKGALAGQGGAKG